MSLLHTLRDRLFFWRKRQAPADDPTVDGCFTLPGARLDDDGPEVWDGTFGSLGSPSANAEVDPGAPAGAADTAG
jgi:hypothetical protein